MNPETSNTPLQNRALRYIEATEDVEFDDVLLAFEPLGIRLSDIGRAVIGLLNSGQIILYGERSLIARTNLKTL